MGLKKSSCEHENSGRSAAHSLQLALERELVTSSLTSSLARALPTPGRIILRVAASPSGGICRVSAVEHGPVSANPEGPKSRSKYPRLRASQVALPQPSSPAAGCVLRSKGLFFAPCDALAAAPPPARCCEALLSEPARTAPSSVAATYVARASLRRQTEGSQTPRNKDLKMDGP